MENALFPHQATCCVCHPTTLSANLMLLSVTLAEAIGCVLVALNFMRPM